MSRISSNTFFRLLIFMSVVMMGSFVLCPYAMAVKDTAVSLQEALDSKPHGEVERVIPSKPQDLFVVLKNGLTVLIRELHTSDVVSCQIHVKAGSIHEGERMGAGLSHYLEHVVSGGTTSRLSEAQIAKRLQSLGGASNAYTSYAQTTYFINTTGSQVDEALALLSSYVTDCQFEPKEYEREKKVIVQEIQMGENSPGRQLWHSFVQSAYQVHPVRNPVIGKRSVFLSMDREDLMAHYHRWYTPDHMIVSVAGDIDKAAVLEKILELEIGNASPVKNPFYVLPQEPPQLAAREVKTVTPIAKITQAMMGFRTVDLTHPDLYALDVLSVILGDGRTSRLYRSLRDEKSLVLSVDTWSWTPHFVDGQFVVSMALSEDKLAEAIAAVWDELEAVKVTPVDERTLSRAVNKVVADHVFGLESAEDQASDMASNWMGTGDPYFSDSYVEKMRKVRPEDISRVAQKYFIKDAMTLAVLTPSEEKDAVASSPARAEQKMTIEKRLLPNQLTLLTKKSVAVPIVTFQFVVKGGVRFEPPGKTGLSRFTAGLLTKGTTTRSKMDIATALEDVGGSISSGSGRNTLSVSVSVLKEHMDLALDVLADVILHPVFPEDEIEKQRQDTLLAIQRIDENWSSEISRMFRRHYYRDHPYRNDVLGKPEDVQGFSKKDIQAFYTSLVTANNAVLAVFGDIDPQTVGDKVEAAFAGLAPAMLEQPIIAMETQNITEDETFVVRNEKTSAAILVGFNGLTLHDADGPAVDVLDAIMSGIGYPSGWLHESLRGGEQSLVYFVHAYPVFGIDGGYFGIMTQTTPENYDDVLRIIFEKIDLIKEREVDEETFLRAKQMCITMHSMGLESIGSQATSAALNEVVGLGYDWDTRYPALVEKVTPADVLRVARKLFSHHLVAATKPSTNTADKRNSR